MRRKKKRKSVCLLSSCGGHLMELMQLLPAVEHRDFYIVTERNRASESVVSPFRHHFLMQQERRDVTFGLKFGCNIVLSLVYLLRERPAVVVTTGAGAVWPTCRFAKWMGIKVVYVESFAKLTSASFTGRLVYRFADRFYVQWPELKRVYPHAEYHGKVY